MKYILALLALIGSSIPAHTYADLWWFTIEDYFVDMLVKTDWSMDVKETIQINFNEQRRGIYRTIPIQDAQWDYIHVDNIAVLWGDIASNKIEDWMYTVKIGNANVYVYWPMTYVISYTVKNAIKAYAGSGESPWRQELYRNIVWWARSRNVPINNFRYNITTQKPHTFSANGMFVFRWVVWERLTWNATISQTQNGTIIGWLSKPLPANNGITIGLQFPSNFFVADTNYNKLFTKKPVNSLRDLIVGWFKWLLETLSFERIFNIFVFLSVFFLSLFRTRTRWNITWRKPGRKSAKAITPYYLPPRDIQVAKSFWFWYNAENPQIFVAMLYYRASKWWVHISLTEGKKYFLGIKWDDTYIISEVVENPPEASELDKVLLQAFFGQRDRENDKISLDKNSYRKMERVLSSLKSQIDWEEDLYVVSGALFFKKYTLTPMWERIFEELRWFREYLLKVERPAIEKELKNNPEFFNTILPRAVLFGVESRLLKLCEDMLKDIEWYDSYNGTMLNQYAFASMTSHIKTSIIQPRSTGWGSSWSGFSSFGGGGGWGFSWWGWGGGWWWSR